MDFPQPLSPEKEKESQITVESGAFDLKIDDNDLANLIDRKVDESTQYYKNELHLDSRRQTNEDFWIGKQFDESKLYDWQVPYKDNIIWQDLETRIAIASSRMPDIVVTPSGEEVLKGEIAKSLEKALDIKIRNDTSKRLIKHGLRNLALYLQSAIKCRWDKNKGENGDYIFELTRPQRITVDHTATIPDDGFTADNMDFIVETLEEPIALVASKFPAKKDELFLSLGIIRGTQRQMATKMKYQEVWFTWYDASGDIYEGVCWKYKKIILSKMKNPYYDWEGYDKKLDEPKIVDGKKTSVEKLYHNHFDRPRKPYLFLSHQSLGRNHIDDTSPVEQSIPLQKIVNKRGRQITQIADRAVPKLAFSGKYIDKENARRVTNDPDEHIWIQNTEDINRAVMYIPAQQPSPILYQDLVGNRMQIDSKFATHATTRGETQPSESGISKQITREGDLMVSDDIVNIVVERVVYEMANWATQMMKVMYDKPHFVKNLGKNGEYLQIELTRDKIEDGIAVNVKASSVDKQQKRNDALVLAARRSIDPLTLIEDLDMPNPKERAKRLLLFLTQDYAGYAKVAGIEMPEAGMAGKTPDESQQQAILDIQRIQAGEDFEPEFVDEAYLKVMLEFEKSDNFQQLDDETKQRFVGHIAKLRTIAEQQGAGQGQAGQVPPGPVSAPQAPPAGGSPPLL